MSKSWTLSSLNISAYDRILHVSVYYNRAFLCLQSEQQNETVHSIIEATWPENLLSVQAKVFPNEKKSGGCKNVENAKATDVDGKGRLWVADDGSQFCTPKLFVYDLLYFNEEIHFASFSSLKGEKMSKILVDPLESENGDTRAYISLHNRDFLVVYSLLEKKMAKLKFTNDFVHPSKSISFNEMVITPSMDLMYISDGSTGNLYSMSLTPVRFLNLSNFNGDSRKLSIRSPLTFIGSLLGPAKALTMSPKGEVLYIVDRFSAVALWNPKTPLQAEYHEIIYQTTRNLSHLLCGHKGSVYVIAESVVKISLDGRWKHTVKIKLE